MTEQHKSELHEIVSQGYDLAPGTRERYLRDLDVWIKFAGVDPAGWTPERAQAFYADLLERMGTSSANRLLAAIGYASRWYANAKQDPRLDFAIIRKAKAHTDEDDVRRALTEPDAKRLLETCLGDHPICLRDMAMMVVELETGMRRMSLQSMTIETIDRESKGYPVTRVLMKGHGDKRVSVPLSDTALIAIDRWLKFLDRKRGPVFVALTKTLDGKGRVNYKPSTTPLSEQAIHKIIAGRGTEVELKIYPHLFRHTFVTWRVKAGLLPHEVAAVTGHKMTGALGAMAGYIDEFAIAQKIRNSTPQWLKAMFS